MGDKYTEFLISSRTQASAYHTVESLNARSSAHRKSESHLRPAPRRHPKQSPLAVLAIPSIAGQFVSEYFSAVLVENLFKVETPVLYLDETLLGTCP